MDLMNLCRGLGIILDNAIEESQLCENPHIEIAFITLDHANLIIIKNRCRKSDLSIEKLYQKGFSTKGENRGRGLGILQEMLRDDGVYLSTNIKNDYFIQEIEIGKGSIE